MTDKKICFNGEKIRFTSKEAALRSLRALINRYRHMSKGHVYECPFCHGWHITSNRDY